MLKRSKMLKISISLISGLTILATTSIIALANNSGYETYKGALIKTVEAINNNMSHEIDMSYNFELDGEIVMEKSSKEMVEKNKSLSIRYTKDSEEINYTDDELQCFINNGKVLEGISHYREGSNRIEGNGLTENQKKLMNIIIDTIVGDMKNHTISSDGKISISLEESQIPSIAQLGLPVFAEKVNQRSYFSEKNNNPLVEYKDLTIKAVNAEGKLDNNGYISEIKVNAIIDKLDNENKVESFDFNMNLNFSNIGTTIVEKPQGVIEAEEKGLIDRSSWVD